MNSRFLAGSLFAIWEEFRNLQWNESLGCSRERQKLWKITVLGEPSFNCVIISILINVLAMSAFVTNITYRELLCPYNSFIMAKKKWNCHWLTVHELTLWFLHSASIGQANFRDNLFLTLYCIIFLLLTNALKIMGRTVSTGQWIL